MMALILCLPLSSADASNVEDNLVIGIQSTKTLAIEPLQPLERDMLSIYDVMYESLITIDDDYMPQPCLADSWEMTGNGKTWTFHLRKDVRFSDGTAMTANDVVATANEILRRAENEDTMTRGYYYNLMYFVKSISAPDEYTVVVKAARSYWGVLYAMTFPVLPATYVSSANPPGTGAYYAETFEPTNYMHLKVNPYWWMNQPQVKEIMVIMSDTPKGVMENYEYARVDTIFTRAIASAQYKSGVNSLALDYRTNQLETLLMNHSSSPLDSIAVRKALRYLIDVDRIASNVYMGMVDRTDTPFIAGTWMYNDNLSRYFVTNKDEALRLLDEDGWADTNDDGYLDRPNKDGESEMLAFRLFVYEEPDNDVRVETANMIADMLEAVGISVTITTLDFDTMSKRLSAGNFDLALVSYAMDVCPDAGFLLMSNNTGNYCRYRSTKMSDLCKDLRTMATFDEYRSKLHEIQAQFAEDCPFLCMFYRCGTVLTRRMYTTTRDVRELELLDGIDTFHP